VEGELCPPLATYAALRAWIAGAQHGKAFEAVNGRKIKRQDTIKNDKTLNE
jgi:hypothetical protein